MGSLENPRSIASSHFTNEDLAVNFADQTSRYFYPKTIKILIIKKCPKLQIIYGNCSTQGLI